MFKYYTLLCLLVINLILSADGMRDFMKLQEKFSQYQSLKVKYKETTSYKIVDKNNSSEGVMYYMKPNLYRIESQELDVYANEFQVWNYDKTNKQTIIQKRKSGANPIEFLILNNTLMEFYELISAAEKKLGKNNTREYVFLRMDTALEYPFLTIRVYINKKNNQPILLVLEDPNETRTSIEIKEFKENIKLKHSFFEYQKKMGVEEIKMF